MLTDTQETASQALTRAQLRNPDAALIVISKGQGLEIFMNARTDAELCLMKEYLNEAVRQRLIRGQSKMP